MRIKDSVRISGISPEAVLAVIVANSVFSEIKKDCVITSVTDGDHMEGSLHHAGFAFDLRTRHLEPEERILSVKKLRERLGPAFDVLLEDTHIHVEYDPE